MKIQIKALTQLSVDGRIIPEGGLAIIDRTEAQIKQSVLDELYEVVEKLDEQPPTADKGKKDK